MVAGAQHDTAKVAAYYAKSEGLYEEAYGGAYDNVYMDFLRSASLFYANSHDYPAAIQRAEKVLHYLSGIGQDRSLQAFYQLLNIGEINYLTGRYKEAKDYAERSIVTVDSKMKDGYTLLDSVKMEVLKPKAILIRSKAIYAVRATKDTAFLRGLSDDLATALSIVDKRKGMIDDYTSTGILIADNQELIDFAKKISLELYQQTGMRIYLDRFINLHESALYNRIRSRLDRQEALRFSKVPVTVALREQELKKEISASLDGNAGDAEVMNRYFKVMQEWEQHLDSVKGIYPAYYSMRYGSIFKPLTDLQVSLNDSTTLIRYFFADGQLYALVADKGQQAFIPLDCPGLKGKIGSLLSNTTPENSKLSLLHDLYKMLWAPLEGYVHTKSVVVIPDGILYNLSFDMLVGEPVHNFSELASQCLLNRYAFSYHYSLYLLGKADTLQEGRSNYIAFAPGFSDELKDSYRQRVKNPVDLDNNYLHLLPQPNTHALATNIKDMIGGEVYLDEHSTQGSFRQHAAKHSVIHIATHALYDDLHPGQSGLVFAKGSTDDGDDNFLSLYDIYGCDLSSDLTLLTACESGRPGYSDGEGMVSLAHAFNYAGSQHILTALWPVDDQSSNRITEYFIRWLHARAPTDIALQKAKLQYLQEAKGRMLAPSYWSGLVLLGDAATIALSSPVDRWISPVMLMTGGISFLAIIILAWRKRKRQKEI